MRFIGTFVILLGLWLLLSGIYEPMIIGFGVFSVLVAIVFVARMDAADGDRVRLGLRPWALIRYVGWLMVEIAKANWTVTKIVLSPNMKIHQHLFVVPYSQKTDLAQVIYANSITLTPGTITVETESRDFLVHALAFSPNDITALANMDRRVTATESGAA